MNEEIKKILKEEGIDVDNKDLLICCDGKLTNDKCPDSKGEKCNCGGALEGHYGHAPYGLGAFNFCIECRTIYDFVEDVE